MYIRFWANHRLTQNIFAAPKFPSIAASFVFCAKEERESQGAGLSTYAHENNLRKMKGVDSPSHEAPFDAATFGLAPIGERVPVRWDSAFCARNK